jgi:hypothetical protein
MKIRILLSIILVSSISPAVHAQATFEGWVDSQIAAALSKAHNAVASDSQMLGQNGKGSDRQKESPSADPRSTSLVDQSSATDFFSVAANVIPVAPGLSQFTSGTGSAASNPSTTGSTTATASLYSFLVAFNKKSQTDPQFYKDHVFSRRISFTIGTAASEQATDNTTTPATVYGSKVLLINKRELYTRSNLAELAKVQKSLSDALLADVRLKPAIQRLVFGVLHPADVRADGTPDPVGFGTFLSTELSPATYQGTINGLSPETKKQIDALIETSLDVYSRERTVIETAYNKISKGMQMSVSYTANIRDPKGNNDHRAELIFDYGLSSRINWTFNASADYTDRKMAVDSRGGRAATEFRGNLTKSDSAWGRSPAQLSFSGEAKWQTAQKPQYTFQAKLTIPLSKGIDLPIAYQYANRTALLNQADSEAHLGLSIDVSRLFQALKGTTD